MIWPASSTGAGLSPRVRGNPRTGARFAIKPRSIPACAGEPADDVWADVAERVYPRVCGGTGIGLSRFSFRRGLSPRVRGNRQAFIVGDDRERSIPACAGEPPDGCGYGQAHPVYPRVCGGTRRSRAARWGAPGLSPRVRGNLLGQRSYRDSARSIPACAGEPSSGRRWQRRRRVYPRVCGGTSYPLSAYGVTVGLSPRVRGNPVQTEVNTVEWGSIPACAGEPLCRGDAA